jgi:spore germination cell wall hydrolase CwlJ-like protein
MTALDIRNALTDRQATAVTVFGEARREPLLGQHAVAWVIRNRTLYPQRFGTSWKGVCLRPSQFSCWYPWGGASNYAAVMAAAEQLVQHLTPAPGSALARALQVADDVMGGTAADPTHGADHYYAPLAMVPPGRVPVWAQGHTPTVVIGAHRFYRLVAGTGQP